MDFPRATVYEVLISLSPDIWSALVAISQGSGVSFPKVGQIRIIQSKNSHVLRVKVKRFGVMEN